MKGGNGMERKILDKFKLWKESANRKPLILGGVRQVGKTWALKEFGRVCYRNVAYFNFEERAEYRQFFETTMDVGRILRNLSMAGGQPIEPGETLLVFDEIQDCPEALTSLKYFFENAPEYHVACAGSLLGVMLARPASFPVGKVDFLYLNPMTFTEFLAANESDNLAEYLESVDEVAPLPDVFFNPLCENLKMYFVTGGMPESVKLWTSRRDVGEVQQSLSNLLNAYERDFAKHPERKDVPKISMIWNSIPSQLARENKKFLYRAVKEGARAREYEDALQWLCDSGLAHKTYRSELPKPPLKAYDDISAFKIYMVDTGLLRRMASLDPSVFAERERLFLEFNGALSENYILQALTDQFELPPRYWTKEGSPRYEVDFLIQRKNAVYPVEVKAGGNVEGRSLKKYAEIYGTDVPLRIRFSLRNLKLDGDTLNIPLFMADQIDRLISLCEGR